MRPEIRSRLSLAALAVAFSFALPVVAPAADEIDGLAAVVNGKVITVSQVRQAIAMRINVERLGNQRLTREDFEVLVAKIEKEALQDLIDRELILDAFQKQGGSIRANYVEDSINQFILDRFDNDREKFINDLRDTGMTLKQFRTIREEALIVQAMRSQAARNMPPPTPAERDTWYKENIDRFRGEDFVDLRTITIPKVSGAPGSSKESQRQLVDEIRSKIAEGADFSLIAKTYSEDSKASKGGDWGTIKRGDFKALLSDAAFALPANSVSKVLEDEKNYYLLWVDDVHRGSVTPLSEIRDSVDQFVTLEKRQAAHEKWIKRLREAANITIFEKLSNN